MGYLGKLGHGILYGHFFSSIMGPTNPRIGIRKGTTVGENFVGKIGPLNTTLDFVWISSGDTVPHFHLNIFLGVHFLKIVYNIDTN